MGAPKQKSVRSNVPKKASSDTTELNITLTVGREATWVVVGRMKGDDRSAPAVPRTRRSTPVVRERRVPGRRMEEGDHFFLATRLK
jgi:hypothetical protein